MVKEKIKLCECGCGKPTLVITHTQNKIGKVKGEYNKFIMGHSTKGKPKSEAHRKKIGLGNFKTGRISRHGYIAIYTKNHPYSVKIKGTGYVLEHRLVMEKHLGRYLKPTEIVHHIDGNQSNNVISNLMLFPNQSAHVKFHHIFNNNKKMKGGIN